jgi:DNA-binding NarL/FixJ family response regulator
VSADRAGATPVRVAIVEDNDAFREMLELLFGMREEVDVVGSASTGDDAPALARRVAPDVVLMDYRMPGLNGAEATEAVLAAAPDTKVICLTASVSDEEAEEVLAAGAVACVTKDEDFDHLLRVVCEAAAS